MRKSWVLGSLVALGCAACGGEEDGESVAGDVRDGSVPMGSQGDTSDAGGWPAVLTFDEEELAAAFSDVEGGAAGMGVPSDGTAAADAGITGGGAGGSTAGGAGTAGSCSGGGSVADNGDGVMTSYPNVSTSVTPSTYTMLTMNFTVTEDGDSRGPLLELFAEIRNDRGSRACVFLPEVYLDGMEIITLARTQPYQEHNTYLDSYGSTTRDCIEAGEAAVFYGVARGISEADVRGASRLTVDVGSRGDDVAPTYEYLLRPQPTLDAMVIRGASGTGWTLTGTMTPHEDFYNYGMRVYPRDDRGLLFAELLAFPGELGQMYAGVDVDFETTAAPCNFQDYYVSQSWIDGM